ncbi:MAG: hypothetical protein ACREK3_04075 [Gemmatimonadota bacterium]
MSRGKCSPYGVVCLCVGIACAAPISTQRSPMHLRVIEIRNDTNREIVCAIEPTADSHLRGPTTFTGWFKPGQRKTLYLYHGLSYQVDVLEPDGAPLTRGIFQVDRDLRLAFGGESLEAAPWLAVRLGGPTVIVADSLRRSVPFDAASRQLPATRGPASRRGQP